MKEKDFWEIIGISDKQSLGDLNKQIEFIEKRLDKLSIDGKSVGHLSEIRSTNTPWSISELYRSTSPPGDDEDVSAFIQPTAQSIELPQCPIKYLHVVCEWLAPSLLRISFIPRINQRAEDDVLAIR